MKSGEELQASRFPNAPQAIVKYNISASRTDNAGSEGHAAG
tara:strand:+ start:67 stop:189 length:123 start_codon:yes stop_codon:yes gene_type:complete